MDRSDEPVMDRSKEPQQQASIDHLQVKKHIRDLILSQPFAVLCTQGDGQPYGSVVAYATDPDVKTAVFATARATRKYRLLTECDRVALVIDSRSTYPDDLMQVEAITATGQATELAAHECDIWANALVARHPGLRAFVENPSTALFKITISRYLHVSRFQEVHQWLPNEA